MDEEDDDEQTPDFEDLLAAYDLSDTATVSSTAPSNTASSAAGAQVNVGASGSGSSTSMLRAGGFGDGSGTSSLSILKEMARMEPPIRDANISIRTASSEIVVKENGVVDFRKPFCPPKSVSGGKPANMQRIILDLAQQKADGKARVKPSARKTTSCKTLLTSNGPRPLLTTATKAKKSVMHLGPIRTPAFSGLQPRVIPTSTKFTASTPATLHIPQSVCTSNVAFDEEEEEAVENGGGGTHDENGFSDAGDGPVSSSPALEDDPIEEASHQLYTCVLPPYVPKASFSSSSSSDDHQRGYPCLDCADRFLVEPSLTAHLERRSVHITLNCSACKQEIVFHNRCSLLGHVRTHRERNQPSDLSNIIVRPLEPSEFVGRSATSLETNDQDNENGCDDDDVKNLNGSNVKTSKYQCHECQQYCGSSLSLQEHFGYSRSRAVNTVKCVRCHSLCPTKCSLSAHLRLHDRQRPFLCPECGLIVADSWDVFQRHLSTVCLHLSRTTGYKCPTAACDALYSTPSELGDHVVDSHGDSLHKCQGCPMAFRSRESFEVHRLEKHGGGGPDSAVQCRTVSRCPLCDVVFQNTGAFRTHLGTHADSLEQDLRFLYRCSVCKLFLEDKSMLSRHLKRNHPSVFKMRCKICRSAFRDLDLLIDHMRRKHPEQTEALKEIEAQTAESKPEALEADQHNNSHADDASDQSSEMLVTLDFEDGVHQSLSSSSSSNNNINNNNKKVECRQCRRSFHSTLGLKMHLLRSHSADDKRSWCAVCSEYLPDPKEMAQHGHTVHLDAGQLVCTLCSNTVFGTKFGLAKHLDQHAEGPIGYPLECVHCDLNLEDAKAAANHWKSEHRLFSFTCDQCDAQYLQENSFLRHKRCAHGEGDANKKYYRCSMCEDVDFAKRSNLVHHLETKHGIPRTDIDLTQLVSTQCLPAAKFQASSSSSLLTSTPIATPTPPSPLPLPPSPPPEPEPIQPQSTSSSPSKRKKKRKRKKETKRDRKKRRSGRSSTSRSSKKTSSESKSTAVAALSLAITEANSAKKPLDEEKENNEEEQQQQEEEVEEAEAVEEKSPEPPPEKKPKLDHHHHHKDQEAIERHVCAKCKYEASKRSEFVDHIRQHKKAGDNNYQCLECGLCFVVEPSLRKHLTYVHKVRDVDKFMTDKSYPTYVTSTCNGTVLLESLSSVETTASSDKDHQHHHQHHPCSSSAAGSDQLQQRIFQCDVCRNTFDTELALRTHMRTHGMAFLKIKRISNVTVNEVSRTVAAAVISSPHKK